ncbi:hypothetical protein BDV25DRAFT_170895 [Aspergillus avenaceus]|uniref:Acetamidase/Formamidase n=1 Tax=Aspergillus avenaceus TaxID=36643 RepID=A0A5N6TFW5_ASPAV|nr:hypothetical protein BDV25DRAFT_170895 [Aspergillus avenaceus]
MYHIRRDHSHLRWSRKIPPVLTISSGETVTFDAIDSSNGQINKDSTATAVSSLDLSTVNPVFGPIHVRGAEPGDVLKVEVLDLETADWGWSAIIPGFGLLADEFPKPSLQIWNVDKNQGYVSYKDTIHVPLRPFLGCMGVAPATDEDLSLVPPTDAGGNMDCRDLTVGSVVYIPVQTQGALFSCGDGHAAQGHGEVCGTAIETAIKATLRFEVCKGLSWVTSPHYENPPRVLKGQDSAEYAVMGIDGDVLEATKKATRGIIAWLTHFKGLSQSEAYMLTSVAGNFHLVETVNVPHYIVSMSLPLGVFRSNG